jgi:hypothetical protein
VKDRSKETSNALTEVRTVLSRAETALYDVRRSHEGKRNPDVPDYKHASGEDYSEWHDRAYIIYEDEDKAQMVAALERVVELLKPWAGKRRRPKGWRK